MSKRTADDDDAPSSPACSMHEADAHYMGYAGAGELIVFLRELLDAARASEPVTVDGAETVSGLLIRHLIRLGASPTAEPGSPPCGCSDQARTRVARRLREMLPRVRDDALHADLRKLLRWDDAAADIDRSGPAARFNK